MENYTIQNYHHDVNKQFIPSSSANNKYVYFKQNFVSNPAEQRMISTKVLVNPHFNKKVFVNPNYHLQIEIPTTSSGKIHVNPKITTSSTKIHVNPKLLQKTQGSLENKSLSNKITTSEPKQSVVTYSSKTKLIRAPVKEQTIKLSKRVRRTSICSKYKLVKSSLLTKKVELKSKNKLLFNSTYKLKRESTNKVAKNRSRSPVKHKSRFKLDNRSLSSAQHKSAKYLFVNRFLSISDIAKKVPLRTNRNLKLVNISGVIYKNSPNRLQRIVKKENKKSVLPKQNKQLRKTRYKIVRSSQTIPSAGVRKKSESLRTRLTVRKQKVSIEKLKKCNIPCPLYRKFGKCKGKEMGKCLRKHDPDQIALCTKFLQGACIDPKCLLSHNVSAEKMPTCKFYLEGSCSREACPYLHVRISPKADICREFIEGFCKKALECDKRHQFLCPDFEKKSHCLKTRCPYPHGRMVRKYSDYNKHKFAKKSSLSNENTENSTNKTGKNLIESDKIEDKEESNPTVRYYSDKKRETEKSSEVDIVNQEINFRLRPKLGDLPSFISLEDA